MYRLAYITYTVMVASAGVTFVFLEDVERQFGLPAWGVGLIAGLGFFTAVLASLLISPYGDRGHLRLLGLVSFITSILGNVLFAVADTLWLLALSRAATGIGVGIFAIVARKALIGDDTADSGEKIGALISAAVAGFIAGPAIGAQLSNYGGIPTPYLALSAVLLIAAFPTMRWISTVEVAVSDGVKTREMLALTRLPGMRAAVAAQLAVFFNIGVFDATVDEYLTDLGLSNSGVGLAIAIAALPLLFVPRLVGRYVDSTPRPEVIMVTALILFVPIVLTIGLWTGVVVFVTLAVVQTTMESVMFPAAIRVAVDETGAAKSATGTGLLDATGSLAAGISAVFAPVLYDATNGPAGPFVTSASFAFLMLILAWNNIETQKFADWKLALGSRT